MLSPPVSGMVEWEYHFFFKMYIAASTQEYIGVLANSTIARKGRECSGGLGALPGVCRDRAKPPTPCPRNGSDRVVWERSQALPSAHECRAVSLMSRVLVEISARSSQVQPKSNFREFSIVISFNVALSFPSTHLTVALISTQLALHGRSRDEQSGYAGWFSAREFRVAELPFAGSGNV